MDLSGQLLDTKINEEGRCLIDSVTTHITLKDKKYFMHITLAKANVLYNI